jgi:hypothetical protein
MSLLNRIFHRHETTEAAPSNVVNWPGKSGTNYPYEVYPLDASFPSLPGNYIYAGTAADGSWVPIYVAQTRGMHQRLEGHVHAEDAMAQGATHIHVHLSNTGQAARCSEEHDLIQLWHPVCNEAVEG